MEGTTLVIQVFISIHLSHTQGVIKRASPANNQGQGVEANRG